MYTGNEFAGYKMAGGNVVTAADLMAAAVSADHSYYNKTVGKTVGVVGVNPGVIAGQKAEEETYVMHQGHKFMIPAGATIMYGADNTFAGYMMAGGEMINTATLMATSEGMHSYYNKDAVTVGMNAGKIGIIAGKVGMQAGNIGVKEGMMAAKTSMDATYVEHGGYNFMIPAGA
jgi:hypothetical protein